MHNTAIGVAAGLVAGVVVGITVIAPMLNLSPPAPERQREAKPGTTAVTRLTLPPKESNEAVVRWRMGSAYAASLPQLGSLAKRLEERIWRVSGGTMEIRFHEPDTLVPTARMFDAVASGAIDAAFSSPALWADRAPALQLFAAVPFGPAAPEFLAWVYFGGGRQLMEDVYRRQNVHGIICGLIAPEASGWFRKEIRVLEDLGGLRMGMSGLGAKVMAKLGVQTVSLAGGDMFVALERGEIDATEFSMPAIDLKLGFHRMGKHYYFPGWHQPATLFDLIVNKGLWDALDGTRKAQVEAVCGDNVRHGLAEGEALQFQALKELQSQGVRLHRWPTEIMEALERSWSEVADEEAAADPDFKDAWKSLSAFREDYAIWRELGYP